MNISNRVDYLQEKLDSFCLALHLPSFAISGSTNEKIYNQCRKCCGDFEQISYTEIAEVLNFKRKIKPSNEWQLFSNASGHLISINSESEVIIHYRDRGKKLGEGEKTAHTALWLKNDGTIQPLPELVVKPSEAVEAVLEGDKLAKKANLFLAPTASIQSFTYKNPSGSLETRLLYPSATDLHEPIRISEAAKKFKGMAGSVVAFHEAGYIHRNIKPENFLENKEGVVRLTGWEFAVTTEGAANGREVVSTQKPGVHQDALLEEYAVCSPPLPQENEYLREVDKADCMAMAPELLFFEDYPPYSAASDIYALGIAFSNFLEIVSAKDEQSPACENMKQLIACMCAEKPAARPTAEQVVEELDRIFTTLA